MQTVIIIFPRPLSVYLSPKFYLVALLAEVIFVLSLPPFEELLTFVKGSSFILSGYRKTSESLGGQEMFHVQLFRFSQTFTSYYITQ